MKPKGYILFVNYNNTKGFGRENRNSITIYEEFCDTKKELAQAYWNHWDDKWDVPDRDTIHYFYLDLKSMEFIALPKYKDPYNKKDGPNTDHETVISTKIFKTPTVKVDSKPKELNVLIENNIEVVKLANELLIKDGDTVHSIKIESTDTQQNILDKIKDIAGKSTNIITSCTQKGKI